MADCPHGLDALLELASATEEFFAVLDEPCDPFAGHQLGWADRYAAAQKRLRALSRALHVHDGCEPGGGR